MLRLLGGSKGSSSSSSSSKIPIVSIHVPAFGGIFLDAPTESGGPDDYVAPDREYRMIGEIEVEIPLGFGRKRCRGVKVGYRSTINLDLGPGRMGEEDILFDRRGEVLGGSTEGLWLEEGSQKFDFTIMIPSNLAPHDWHTNGSIKHRIYALVEGLPTPASSSKSKSFPFKHKSPAASRSRSRTPRGHGSRSHSRSNSPAPSPPLNLDVITAKLSLDGSQTSLPVLPAYQDLEQEDDWLYGTYEAKRTSMLVYNPKPQGGVAELDDRSNGFVPGLGVWDTRFFSDSFSISALLEAQLRISSLTPATTVFAFRISLAQTHTIISPRDDPATAEPVTSTRYFIILEEGRKPPKAHTHPSTDWPAIWRGAGADGRDTGDLDVKAKGRLPADTNGRPSTLPGVVTPIKVSHALLAEVFFSVYGEDEKGKPMTRPGAGGLKILRINRPVLVSSCALMPHAVDPPAYTESENLVEPYRGPKYDKPCSVCGTRPSKRFCETCPKGIGLHPRHDHDPKKVGDPQGRCPVCSKNVMPTGEPQWHHQQNISWHYCACGMPFEEMDERMRERERQARNGVTVGDQDLRASVNIKEEAEQRGRSRRLE